MNVWFCGCSGEGEGVGDEMMLMSDSCSVSYVSECCKMGSLGGSRGNGGKVIKESERLMIVDVLARWCYTSLNIETTACLTYTTHR